MTDQDPIGTPEEVQIGLDASIESNKRTAAELARAAENLFTAWRNNNDPMPYYQALSAAPADWNYFKHSIDGR